MIMSEPIFVSSRSFRVWVYVASHGTLLLRSVKDETHPTRLDVLFKSTRYMSLPAVIDGLVIRENTTEEPAGVDGLRALIRKGDRMLTLGSKPVAAWVVAGLVEWHEDDGDYGAPSYFSDVPRMTW
jgi:hypothetical protein